MRGALRRPPVRPKCDIAVPRPLDRGARVDRIEDVP